MRKWQMASFRERGRNIDEYRGNYACRFFMDVNIAIEVIWLRVVAAIGIFVLGLAFGSFCNVLIYRLPRRLTFLTGRSFCPACGHPIRSYDNIPLFSYALLRGKCRDCGVPISLRYPFVELACGLLYLGVFWHVGWGWRAELIPELFFVTVLLIVSGIDLAEQIIPNRVIIPSIVVGLVSMGIVSALRGDRQIILHAAYGMLIGGGFLGLIAFLVPRGMGMGDAKLEGFVGLFLGFYVLAGLFLGFLAGSIGGVIMLAVQHKGRRERIPFGPFLALGAVLALFWGEPLYRLYRSIFNLG